MSTEEAYGGFSVDELRAELHPGSWRSVQGLATVLTLNADRNGVCPRSALREWMRNHWKGDPAGTDGNGSRSSVKLRQYLLELEHLEVIWRNDDDTVTVIDWTALNEVLDWELQ